MSGKELLFPYISSASLALVLSGCTPVTLTSWKNPKVNEKISKIVVWGMFRKVEYEKPFEDAMVAYLNSKGVKALSALDFLNPSITDPKYVDSASIEIAKKLYRDWAKNNILKAK